MTKENKPTTIIEALHLIQQSIKAPKNQHNKFGGYNYRSCEDILEGAKKVLPKGAALTVNDEIVCIGNRFYVKATATLHFGGESIWNIAYAREAETKKGMDESQITGAASSYARKYALNGLLMIDDTKDADATEKHGKKDEDVESNVALATGGPIMNSVAREEQEEMHKSALILLNACANLDSLGKMWKKHYNAWHKLDADLFADIEQKKDELKVELGSNILNAG